MNSQTHPQTDSSAAGAAANAGPLGGITVIDLTRNLAGPYCTMVLADLGARVIKVERPVTGDDTRHWRPPSWQGESSLFLAVNRNKESFTVDIDSADGAEAIRRLAATADVLVESFKGGSLAKRGLDYETLSVLNPRLVYCSMSGYGSKGPYADRPGYDTLVQAYSGIMSITGEQGGRAVRTGPSIIDMTTGMWGVVGVQAALRSRDATGRGQHVETSLLETGVSWMSYFIAGFFADGTVPKRMGSSHSLMAPYEEFATREGNIFVAAPNDRLFAKLCAVLGLPDLPQDARFRRNPDRLANRAAMHALLAEAFRNDDASSWERRLLDSGIPCSQIKTIDQVVTDPQVLALGMFRSYSHSHVGDLQLVDHPISYDGTRSFRHDGAPALGEHSVSILQSLGYSQDRIEAMVKSGSVSLPAEHHPR